jgi:hypothetical protein
MGQSDRRAVSETVASAGTQCSILDSCGRRSNNPMVIEKRKSPMRPSLLTGRPSTRIPGRDR